jgi:predicted dehydrogenase
MERDSTENSNISRREYLKRSALGASGLVAAPTIFASSAFGKSSPNDTIQVGQIGCGRIARGHDLPETMKETEDVRVVAVSDVDRQRMEDGKALVEKWYAEETGEENYVDVQTYQDYRKMLAQADIDAVVISTPDHWHAQPVVEAALAGIDIYMQNSHSLTVREGRTLLNVLQLFVTASQV